MRRPGNAEVHGTASERALRVTATQPSERTVESRRNPEADGQRLEPAVRSDSHASEIDCRFSGTTNLVPGHIECSSGLPKEARMPVFDDD